MKLKKQTQLATLVLATTLGLTSCFNFVNKVSLRREDLTKHGHSISSERPLGAFSRLEVSSCIRVIVKHSDMPKMEVIAPDQTRNLDIELSNGTLRIKERDKTVYKREDGVFKVVLHTPSPIGYIMTRDNSLIELDEKVPLADSLTIDFSSASYFSAPHLGSLAQLRIKNSGAAEININGVDVMDTRLNLSGASEISIKGTTDRLAIDASGASEIDMKYFSARTAEISFSGASEASISIRDSLSYSLSGASELNFYGSPVIVRSDESGASEVNFHTALTVTSSDTTRMVKKNNTTKK